MTNRQLKRDQGWLVLTVDDILAETDTSSVRADGDAELRRHEKDGENLVDTGKTARVDLDDVDGLGLEKLLENHPVVGVLSRGDSDAVGLEGLADLGMAGDVVRGGGLLNEPRVERLELLHVVDSLSDVPDLVGVDHENAASGSGVLALDGLRGNLLAPLGKVFGVVNDLADNATAAEVVLDVRSDLKLEVCEVEFGEISSADGREKKAKSTRHSRLKPCSRDSLVRRRTLSSS